MALKEITIYLLIGTVWWTTSNASTEYNRYLTQIFQKYGSGDTISFEGLEHLMYSLGLGHIKFDPMHTIEEHRSKDYNSTQENATKLNTSQEDDTLIDVKELESNLLNLMDAKNESKPNMFREMHDPKHRHTRESSDPLDGKQRTATSCLSPKSMLSLLVEYNDENNEFINKIRLKPKDILKLCPAMLAQLDNGVCMRPAPPVGRQPDKKDMIWNAWIYATISMFVLAGCGMLGILLVPLMKSVAYQEILKFLVAIAVGTLAGDALMHLLPHALFKEEKHEHALETKSMTTQESGHKHSNEAALLCGCAFLAALFMYVLENVLPLLKGGKGGHGHSHGHAHGHSHAHASSDAAKTSQELPAPRELNVMLQEAKLDEKTPSRPLTPVAFMVIIGDGLHNLTDGLAIGAAFASDPVTGLATAFAVLCHELPHELGDFALLLQTGVSVRRAVYMNIVSSVLGFVGMSIGLLLVGMGNDMTQWIYAATAGSFLYIAFADLVPTMSVAHNPELVSDPKGIIIQIVGIFLGGLIMLIIAMNEHDLEGLFKSF